MPPIRIGLAAFDPDTSLESSPTNGLASRPASHSAYLEEEWLT